MSETGASETIHATAVAVGESGILIRGRSGAGKSSLALQLIDDPRLQATLVGDDRISLTPSDDGIIARPRAEITGLFELRGVGIIRLSFRSEARIALVVDLLPLDQCTRLPDEEQLTTEIVGLPVPRLMLPIGAIDAALRVRLALRHHASVASDSGRPCFDGIIDGE